GKEHANPPHALTLLRARRERPADGTRAAEKRDELTPHDHSITSSASSRNGSGIVSPIDFAVLRLTTSSNCVGRSIGRSPGLAPLSIWSTRPAIRRQMSGRFAA